MKALTLVLGAITLIVLVSALLAFPVMLLWNACLVGAIAGVAEIGFLQAWGILLLCGFLFKETSAQSSK